MQLYLKSNVWDFVLCAIAASALSYTLCSGFYSTQVFQTLTGGLAITGVCLLVTAALFAASFNRQTLMFGSIGVAIVLIAAVVMSVVLSTTPTALDDSAGNYLYFALCTILPSLLVFLLSRWKPTAIVLVVFGVLVCAVIEYLYSYGHLVAFSVSFVALVGLFVYRNYQKSLVNSESEHLAFTSVTASGVGLAVASTLVAAAVAALVLAPLQLPFIDVKLITEHYRAAEIEVKGVGSVDNMLNDQQTNNTNDQISQTSDMNDNSNNQDKQDTENDSSVAGRWSLNTPPWLPYVVVLLIAALVAGSILFKRLRRQQRFRAMTAGDRGGAIEELYLFFMKRFERFKIPQPEALTLSEYVDGFADTFNKFEDGTGTPAFAKLTDVYNRKVFGNGPVSDDDFRLFENYYQAFYKRARKYVGKLKYCLMYFFI